MGKTKMWSNKYHCFVATLNGLLYSEDNGKTWNKSNINTGDFECLITIGNTVIAGSWSNKGLYYSEDNGKTWNQSNINFGYFYCLTVVGNTIVAGGYSNEGLYYSEDNGKCWKQSNITTEDFYNLTVIGSTVFACSDSYKGLYYSEDCGKTWYHSLCIDSDKVYNQSKSEIKSSNDICEKCESNEDKKQPQESLFDKIDQLYKMCNSINEKLDEIKKSIGI